MIKHRGYQKARLETNDNTQNKRVHFPLC